jgi:hypothetical protein
MDTSELSVDRPPSKIPHWRQVFDSKGITPEVQEWRYNGSGTEQDPYSVTWIEDDPRNPMLYSAVTRWSVMMVVAVAALIASLDSSAYAGSAEEIMADFQCSREIYTLGISLFVLGFAIGPLVLVFVVHNVTRGLTYVQTGGHRFLSSLAEEHCSFQRT